MAEKAKSRPRERRSCAFFRKTDFFAPRYLSVCLVACDLNQSQTLVTGRATSSIRMGLKAILNGAENCPIHRPARRLDPSAPL